MKVFLIGMGNMGKHRLAALNSLYSKYDLEVVGFYDPGVLSAEWNGYKVERHTNFSLELLKNSDIDFFIIGTPHNLILKYVSLILEAKKECTILVEKPLGINYEEAKNISKLTNGKQRIFVGLNYRYFDGINHMLRDIKSKKFKNINSLSISMGHGHSSDIFGSWKVNKDMAGGGVIIDPGIHVLNLMQQISSFDSKIIAVHKSIGNFWKTGIEEQCNILLSSPSIPLIHIGVSIVSWRSNFSIRLFGNDNYGILEGRGSHYGTQSYRVGSRWEWQHSTLERQIDTEELISETEGKEVFKKELECIFQSLNGEKLIVEPCTMDEAIKTMKLVSDIYSYE